MKKSAVFAVIVAAVFLTISSANRVCAQMQSTDTYAAKFICGVQQQSNVFADPDAQAGRYSTKVNWHNNTGMTINFRKKIIPLSGEELATDPKAKVLESLTEDQAMEVVCRDIYRLLNINIPPNTMPPFIEGFVILEVCFNASGGKPIGPRPDPLDVVGVYTYKGDLPAIATNPANGSGVSLEVVVYPAKSNSHILH